MVSKDDMVDEVREGRGLAFHCFAGIGRATIMASVVLIRLGFNADEAIEAISKTRGFPVPDTPIQYDWIRGFGEKFGAV